MELYYNRSKLVLSGVLALLAGLVMTVLAFGNMETGRGIIPLIVMILGPTGAKLFMLFIGAAAILAGLRLFWLTGERGLAASISKTGVRIRATLFSEHLGWNEIGKVELARAMGWGPQPVIVMGRREEADLFKRLLGGGNKVVLPPKLLKDDDIAIAQWIAKAVERDTPYRTRPKVASPMPREFGFGRRH